MPMKQKICCHILNVILRAAILFGAFIVVSFTVYAQETEVKNQPCQTDTALEATLSPSVSTASNPESDCGQSTIRQQLPTTKLTPKIRKNKLDRSLEFNANALYPFIVGSGVAK